MCIYIFMYIYIYIQTYTNIYIWPFYFFFLKCSVATQRLHAPIHILICSCL